MRYSSRIMRAWSKKRLLLISTLFIILHFFSGELNAQTEKHIPLLDSAVSRINRQLEVFPQEKIYVHNDKSSYIVGETVWFRIHLVDALSNRVDTASLYVYGELIDIEGTVVDRVKIIRKDGVYAGYFKLSDDLINGIYTMCFYTKYMENLGEDQFYKRNIVVGSPASLVSRIEPTFEYKEKNKLNIALRFLESTSKTPFIPEDLYIGRNTNSKDLKLQKANSEGLVILSYSNLQKEPLDYLYLQYKYKGKIRKEFVQIPRTNDDYDIQILPEGGKILQGVNNKVAFKVIGTNGLGEDVKLEITDGNEKIIVSAESVHKGMGMFYFTPKKSEQYNLRCTNSDNIVKYKNISSMIEEGHALSLTLSNKLISATINASSFQSEIPLYMIVHSQGNLLYVSDVEKHKPDITFHRENLPSGIINFILLDSTLSPISERLVFNKNPIILSDVQIKPNKSSYKKRSLIKTKVSLSDRLKNKYNGDASVSVIDNNDVSIDSTQNIVSTLLLSSELKGMIEMPSFYFQNTRIADHYLDILMMTQGWRRYDMKRVLQDQIERPTTRIEDSNILSGSVKSGLFLHKDAKNVNINILTMNPFSYETYETDDKGQFYIAGYNLPDSTIYSISAITKKGGEHLDLILDTAKFTDNRIPLTHNFIWQKPIISTEFNSYLAKADSKYIQENGMRVINLAEIEILGKRKPTHTKSKFSIGFGSIYTSEDISKTKDQSIMLYLRSRGVYLGIDNEFGTYDGKLYLRPNSAPALILLDDVKYSSILEIGTLLENIESIEIMNDFYAPIALGLGASGGVILINTKKGISGKEHKYNYARFSPLGYQHQKEFYVPKYETKEEINSIMPDLRTTIHWQPSLDIKNGEAEIQFYASDTSTEYAIIIEGITDGGFPFYKVEKIKISE